MGSLVAELGCGDSANAGNPPESEDTSLVRCLVRWKFGNVGRMTTAQTAFRTQQALNASIERFIKAVDNPWTHQVNHQQVEGYLRGLRAAAGQKKASKKFWHNTLNALKGFFAWTATADKTTIRPFTFENPAVTVRSCDARQVREEQNARPITTELERVQRIFSALFRWRGGAMVRSFSLACFAGFRPMEIQRMAGREAELINLKTRIITLPANISKTRHERHVMISDNPAA